MSVADIDTSNPEIDAARAAIESALDQYCQIGDGQIGDGCPPRLADAIRYSLLGSGKRLRPTLVLIAARLVGGDMQNAIPAACAVEMIHTYSLIHDDLPSMDDDDTRRGKPSCHVKFDEAMAILAGDALQARAFEIVARDIQPPELAARCVAMLAAAAGAANLVGGQVDDLQATQMETFCETDEQKRQALDLLERIHSRKTGAMLEVSLRLGGLIGGGSTEQLAALQKFGKNLGLAFQIVDDLLDLLGDPKTMGKTLGKDSHSGKLTFPSLRGEAASRQLAEQLIEAANGAIQPFGSAADPLRSISRFVLERNR